MKNKKTLLAVGGISLAFLLLFLSSYREGGRSYNESYLVDRPTGDGRRGGVEVLSDGERFKNLIRENDFGCVVRLLSKYDGSGDELWLLSFESAIPDNVRRTIREKALQLLLEDEEADKVLKLVYSQLGGGVDRDFAIGDIFRYANLSVQDFESLILKLDFESEKTIASMKFGYKLGTRPGLSATDITLLLGGSIQGRAAAMEALTSHATSLQGEPLSAVATRLKNSVSIAVELLDSGNLDQTTFAELLESMGGAVPFRLFLILSEMGIQDRVPDKTFRDMARINPTRTLEIALSEGFGREVSIVDSVVNLGKNDIKKAIDFFDGNKGELSKGQKEQFLRGISELALLKGDYDVAREWIDEIEDPNVKRNASGKIWTKERNALIKDVGTDPLGTIANIVNGESNYADYWLEESISTWLKIDRSAVNQWYDVNWKSLPAEKTQYVAAAFAREALVLGDLSTAKEWVEKIQNPKIKERVQKEIEMGVK